MAGFMVAFGLLVATAPMAAAVETENVWQNGQQVVMTVPNAQFPSPANMNAHEDFYEMAPQSNTPQSTDGSHIGFVGATVAHDHTVPGRIANQGTFAVVWHVLVLLKKTGACSSFASSAQAYFMAGATNISNCLATSGVGGALLTSVANIDAAESANLIVEFDTGVVFICPITS